MARDEQLTTYVTEDEKQALRVHAVKQGYSGISGWLRDIALDELEEDTEEGDDTQPGGNPTAAAQTAD